MSATLIAFKPLWEIFSGCPLNKALIDIEFVFTLSMLKSWNLSSLDTAITFILLATKILLNCHIFSNTLFASSIKRYTGIKDFGDLLPGHGGVLDRFDSIIMISPFVYIFLQILI